MNPRGHQFALGHTLTGWSRVTTFTPKQERTLRLAYRGLTPWVYSRYGHRQWAAPWPTTRLVVKDPFAMLSVPAVVRVTGARPVLVYRHPGAVLSSYRRMGWTPDLDEIAPLVPVASDPATSEPATSATVTSEPGGPTDGRASAAEMARFWAALNASALSDLSGIAGAVVVSHEDVTLGGSAAAEKLFDLCGLPWSAATRRATEHLSSSAEAPARAPGAAGLHDFARAPEQVASSWRATISQQELDILERVAGHTLGDLAAARADLS